MNEVIRFDYITRGTTIQTLTGCLIVNDSNGSGLYDCSIYIEDDDAYHLIDTRYFTARDIEGYMKDYDGRNHKIIWDDPDDKEELL